MSSDGLIDGRVRALQPSADGALWVGTRSGLQRFDGRRFEPIALRDAQSAESVMSLHEDADGTLWVGTGAGALYRSFAARASRSWPKAGSSVRRYAP